MKQIGTPIETIEQGTALINLFGAVTIGLAYIAYADQDIYAGLSSVGCLLITGLAGYNTYALSVSGESSFNHDLS